MYGGIIGCIVGIMIVVIAVVIIIGLIGENRKLIYLSGESMKPSIDNSSLLIVEKGDFGNVKVDDVVSFFRYGRRIVHRVVEKTTVNGELAFITKGDNNLSVDSGYLTETSYEGKVTKTVISSAVLSIIFERGMISAFLCMFIVGIYLCIWILIGVKVGELYEHK